MVTPLSLVYPYNNSIRNKLLKNMTISEYKKLIKNDTLMIGLDVSEEKTNRVINRILEVDNFQNVACYCADFSEFVEELAEWGVDGCAKVDFDDADLDIAKLDRFIKSENGYIRGEG